MRKGRKSIAQFKDDALSNQTKISIKGGCSDPLKKIAKWQKKLAKAMEKNKMKDILKYQDKLDCIGYTSDNNGGNGLGIW